MVALSVWGLALEPGKKYDLASEYDIHLTGITFGETVTGEGRSLLKVHTFSFPEDEEDEDEDSDDEEKEDEVSENEEELKETIVSVLVPGRIEYQNLNLVLTTSEEPVMLEITGENTVYLSGNYIEQEIPNGDDMDDMDDDYDLEDVPSDAEMDSDEMDAVLNGELDEDEDSDDEETEPKIQEIVAEPKAAKAASKKRARDAEDDGESSPAKSATSAEPAAKLSKAEKKRLQKKLKAENGEAKPAPVAAETKTNGKVAKEDKAAEDGAAKKPKTTELPGGVKIQDMKVGSGPQAKPGKKIGMRYIGKLQGSNKVFDSNTKGKPFTFVLGKGHVIKGWDEGVAGMAVGGERRITVPPAKGYGSKSTGDIPANSTLIFDVKMVEMS